MSFQPSRLLSSIGGITEADGPFSFPGGVIENTQSFSPAADLDDFDPGGGDTLGSRILFISPSKADGADLVISGIVAPDLSALPASRVQVIYLYNIGDGAILLPDASGDSEAGNRFDTSPFAGGGTVRVRQNSGAVILMYERTGARWLVFKPWGSAPQHRFAQTVGAVTTEIFNGAPLAFSSAKTVKAEITAARVDGGGDAFVSFERRAAFSRAASAASTLQSGTTESGYTEPAATPLGVEIKVGAVDDVSVEVTGIAAETYDWHARIWVEDSP